jgi:hypothetical protein
VRVLVATIIAVFLVSCGAGSADQRNAGATSAASACGSRASSADADGRLIGATLDSTKIRVAVPSPVRAGAEVRLDWHMTSGPGTAPLTMYAERAVLGIFTVRVQPRRVEPAGSENDYTVYITLPEVGCWRMHSERAGGKLSGDIWLPVVAAG